MAKLFRKLAGGAPTVPDALVHVAELNLGELPHLGGRVTAVDERSLGTEVITATPATVAAQAVALRVKARHVGDAVIHGAESAPTAARERGDALINCAMIK